MDHLRQEKSREADGAKRWGQPITLDLLLIRIRFLTGSEAHKETREGENYFKRLKRRALEGWLVDQADGGQEAMKE